MEVKYSKSLDEILSAGKDDTAFVDQSLSVYRDSFRVVEIKFLKKLPFKENAAVDHIKDTVLFSGGIAQSVLRKAMNVSNKSLQN